MKLKSLSLALSLGAALCTVAPASADNFTKAEIENIVKEYLINNPDVLIEANKAAQSRQAELEKAEQSKLINSIYTNSAIPQFGPEKYKHTIVEFFDYNCGYCKRAKPIVLDVLKKHPDTKYFYMEFPILSEISITAAKIGVAIYQKDPSKYVQYSNEFMTRQERLTSEIALQAYVESLGFNWADIKKAADSKEVLDLMRTIRSYAMQLEINGTPAFIVDGEVLHGAPRTADDIEGMFKK